MKVEVTMGDSVGQLLWGAALLAAGVGVLFRIEQVMPRLIEFSHFAAAQWFIRFCFYLMAAILIGGGARKISAFVRAKNQNRQ